MVLLESLKLKLGTPVFDFNLKGIDDKMHSPADFKNAKVLIVAFICNHCPYAQAVWPRLVELQKKYQDRQVQFIGINPNVDNPDYPDEVFDKMPEYARRFKMNFPYLADPTQEVAKNYKAQCTPDIYVYDQHRQLAYHGRVDDNWKEPLKVTKHELDEAIDSLLNGNELSSDQHPSIGCSIKWR